MQYLEHSARPFYAQWIKMNIKDKQPSESLEFADVHCEGEVERQWDGTENYLNVD